MLRYCHQNQIKYKKSIELNLKSEKMKMNKNEQNRSPLSPLLCMINKHLETLHTCLASFQQLGIMEENKVQSELCCFHER